MFRKTLLYATALLAIAAATAATSTPFHFDLDRSSPEAGEAVTELSRVQLWFTQVPQDGTTAIRVVDAGGELVPTGDVVQDSEDGTQFSVALEGPAALGDFTVAWRGMGQDGHVVRDDFSFTVLAR